MWKQKFITCSLLGLICSTNSSHSQQLRLQRSTTLSFPSASAIEFYRNKLYVFGDDAPQMLVLSPAHRLLDSIRYWPDTVQRIDKAVKPDIEAAFLLTNEAGVTLFAIGSHATAGRRGGLAVNLRNHAITKAVFFDSAAAAAQVKEVNIEGACRVKNTLVLANRGHLANRQNHLLYLAGHKLQAQQLLLPRGSGFVGVSGLYYLEAQDRLLFTASEEATTSATADGAIGDSYLGWIDRFSARRKSAVLKPDKLLNLARIHKAFRGQKIESVCAERANRKGALLHLAADNDNGSSRLFTVHLTWKPKAPR